jgi:hypothetical protein
VPTYEVRDNENLISKSVFFYFVHRLYLNKITTFRKLDLLPSSGKKGSSRSEAASTTGSNSWDFVLPFLPEDGRISSFRNVVILLKYRRWAKSKKPLLQVMTHHRQNPLNFIL